LLENAVQWIALPACRGIRLFHQQIPNVSTYLCEQKRMIQSSGLTRLSDTPGPI